MIGASAETAAGPAVPACPCPVCGALAELFFRSSAAAYYRCGTCEARCLDPASRPSPEAEYAHYLHHENAVDDPGYRRFLARLAAPLLDRLPAGSSGLDYGCGPGPALAAMLAEAGHQVAVYDPFFAPDPAPLQRTHDFVTCTEVVEHFHDPMAEFERLRGLVRAGGWLGVMTCFQTDDSRFAGWHYRMDPTHVVFYRLATFEYLARRWGWSVVSLAKDVVLLQKPGAGP